MKALSAAAEFGGRRLDEDERRALEAALRYFRESAPKHNADEEESLFPRLRSLAHVEIRRAIADLSRLEQEHRCATPLHMEVDRLGQQWLANGELGKKEANLFQSAVRTLEVMYRTHIDFEDSVLFPLAARLLSPSQAAEIAEEMAKRRNLSGMVTQAPQSHSANTANIVEWRDPEDRAIDEHDAREIREKMLDKTIADSFPASDPPSSDPAPAVDPFA